MSNKNDLFEIATKRRYRYPSIKGELSTENLWQLPLTSTSGFDLDSVAKAIKRDLDATSEESFVKVQTTASEEFQNKLNVVKRVIAVRLVEVEEVNSAANKQRERRQLMEILARKEDAALEQLSADEIKKRIAELS